MPSPNYSVPYSKLKLYDMFAHKPVNSQPAVPHPPSPQPPIQTTFSPESDFLNAPLLPTVSFNENLMAKLEQMLLELDRLIRQCPMPSCALLPPNHDICLLMRQIPLVISQSTNLLQTMQTFVEKVVYMLYKSQTPFALEAYTGFLQSLFELSVHVGKEALSWIVYADDERKYNAPVIAMLLRHEMLPLEIYDGQTAKLIQNKADGVIDFAADLVRLCLLSPSPVTFLEDHALTLAALNVLVKEEEATASVIALMTDLGNLVEAPYLDLKKTNDSGGGYIGSSGQGCLELRLLLAEWMRLCQHPMVTDQLCSQLATKSASFRRRALQLIDSYAKLVAYMVRLETGEDDKKAKVTLVSHALSVVTLVLAQHHEKRQVNFNQKPFLRILSSLFCELNKLKNKSIESSIILAYSDTLYMLQPLNFPGFAFSWLQLLSHRTFVPQLLVANHTQGWALCQKLVLVLLRFLRPLLETRVLQRATRAFYRGTLRFLVVLLHDFPEFLSDNYMVFSQCIPHGCIQLRNLVLSAFPRVMHLPDPFTPDLCLSSLPESRQEPLVVMSYSEILMNNGRLDESVDRYVCKKEGLAVFGKNILETLKTSEGYDLNLLTAFVLYLGSQTALEECSIAENPSVRAYKYLLSRMSPQGTYYLLNSLVDHLRYPNSHTYFFSTALLYLFEEQPEMIKEQITRVLLERLIVNRPHPWGLLATFIELIKKPTFWEYDFVRCSPDIERLFDNVSRSIKRTAV
ncbi:Not1 transcription factor [Phycomyces blakesleeanus NRRL 1555(-)]|uniref:Not1 transcription factor n=1 Tax=Phycomyces blakesleeanus (strain ATCC 8743b / DSM 1359 / FGSC 10004 / NBRC 33097 / NRRL 1555) TaxID=763407 RepID=A0A167P7D4_PHYB8|nr:Not1 transcription factor [Phycomyces blakesleeanus NRRL 1555(-)]OAD77396.1 Not1 transcription factor [Phycomyces blakesleeanus NRRL 1555(-)]|eukprot:XP_018295436.1 Not1 transcription factor [Phycomyces blakesleeanus NRRL 1555(-)]